MIEVADIFRLHWAEYQQQHPITPTQRKAVEDLLRCRTPALGGELWQCDSCGALRYSYHSCKNRSCPKCHGQQTRAWLEQAQQRLLPCGYYLLTFTLPAPCRALARSHPKLIYSLLLSSAAAALQKLAWDPAYVGARLGMLAVLHTWTRALLYHPHVHLLVSAGGLAKDGQSWVTPKNPAFLVPGFALSKIFRGKFRAGLRKLHLLHKLPAELWNQNWVVHCRHAGSGAKALDYLARYMFRTAIANSRLERFQDGQVTFRYRDSRTQEVKQATLSAEEFIGRFLQHVLPKGFVKARAYGFWSPHSRKSLEQARALLKPTAPQSPCRPALPTPEPDSAPAPRPCPYCHRGQLHLIELLLPQHPRPP
jgi:hypothetical protein